MAGDVADANLTGDACAWSLAYPGCDRQAGESAGQDQSNDCG
jgi:hypothetical protein